MDGIDIERRRQAWSSYWAAGGLHSCIGSLVDDRDGAIGRFWQSVFSGLNDGARVLDVATGNGALPKLLAAAFGGRVQVDAVDLADLAPAWRLPGADDGITFHSGVRMEALPFADATFDLVVSQFGLEYGRWPDAASEAGRVRAAGGRMAFVMHHASSVIVRMGRGELAQQEMLLAEGGLLQVAADFLPHLARVQAGGVPDAEANRARMAYNAVLAQLGERIEQDPAPHLLIDAREQVHGIVGGRFGPGLDDRRARLQGYSQAVADAVVRTRELLACALDEDRAEEFAALLRGSGSAPGVLEMAPLVEGQDIVAWGVRAG